MIRNAPLASRFLNRPLALLPRHSALIFDMVQSGTEPAAALVGDPARSGGAPGYDLVGSVAVIEVQGVLLHGAGWYWWGQSTSYAAIERAAHAAVEDDAVKAIVLDIDSPGGECAGCFDLADALFALRGRKPIHAIVNEAAYSAAYALASAADRVWVSRTGGVGSIGIIQQSTSIAGALDKAGVEVTTLTYGQFKADGVPELKLSGAAIQRMQADIDKLGRLFVATVARNRGLAASKIRGMQAGTFLGADGVAAGLADAVASPSDAFRTVLDRATNRSARMARR